MKKFIPIGLATLFLGPVSLAATPHGTTSSQKEMLPSTQGSAISDVNITRAIRQRISQDDQLSSKARNITIQTQDGTVTLKGIVESETEKMKLDFLARSAAGAKTVNNEIVVTE